MNVNPYQSPAASCDRPIAWSEVMTNSRKPLVVFALGAIAYHLFVWILLRSTPVDQKAGRLLLINTPVFAGWGLALWLGSRHSITLGLLACGMQCVIEALMVLRGIGDWQATVLIDGIILVALIAIVVVCFIYRPVSKVSGEPSDAQVAAVVGGIEAESPL